MALDGLLESHRHLGINVSGVSKGIPKLKRDIHTSLARSVNGYDHLGSGSLEAQFPRELPGWLSKLHNESISLQKQVDIISSLHYSRISERERNVKDPHPRTYSWLFESSKNTSGLQSASNVLDWLHAGSHVFVISGKAGSGKSVLMKYLYNHPETRAALRKWAAGKDLVVAGFFFWSAGTTMQKSQQGLLQSLLMCILKQRPDLIPHLCPDRWNARPEAYGREPWTRTELLEALTKLKVGSFDSARLCIFIDGLDEYEGEMLDLCRLVKDLTASGFLKICVSCRPWIVFEKFFGDNSGKRIYLQHLNRPDIWRFAYEQLTEEINNRWSLMDKTEYSTLVEEITERSSGVFLWVFLVVRSLLRGMTNLDTAEELQARLRELPTELEEFFRCILDRADKIYGKQAARLYILQLKAGDGALSSWDVAHFAEEDQLYALRDDVSSWHAKMTEQLDEITRTRVLVRCQDLLEFNNRSKLQFLHRSVKDFLETRDILDELTRRAGEEFNVHLFICNSMLVQMKAELQHHPWACDSEKNASKLHLRPVFLMRYFWYHTRKLAQNDQLSFELIAAFDETLCSLYSRDCGLGMLSWKSLSDEDYHKGWLLDMAIDADVPGILSLQNSKTNQCVFKNEIWQKSALEKALVYMRSRDRATIVNSLLNRGANPNEMNRDNLSVWESYLLQLSWPPASGSPKIEVLTLERLLNHGADPSVLFIKDAKRYELLSKVASYVSSHEMKLSQDFWQRVLDYLSVERPELPYVGTEECSPMRKWNQRNQGKKPHPNLRRKPSFYNTRIS